MMQTVWWLYETIFQGLLWTLHAATFLGAILLVHDCSGMLVAASTNTTHTRYGHFLRFVTLMAIISLLGLLVTPLQANRSFIGALSAALTVPVAGAVLLLHARRRNLDSAILMIIIAVLAGFATYMHLQSV